MKVTRGQLAVTKPPPSNFSWSIDMCLLDLELCGSVLTSAKPQLSPAPFLLPNYAPQVWFAAFVLLVHMCMSLCSAPKTHLFPVIRHNSLLECHCISLWPGLDASEHSIMCITGCNATDCAHQSMHSCQAIVCLNECWCFMCRVCMIWNLT